MEKRKKDGYFLMTTRIRQTIATQRNSSGRQNDFSALAFITCGSVDDGKSTLIGRLLVDSRTVLQDQLAGVQRGGETDLALLTDGLQPSASKASPSTWPTATLPPPTRKFIIGDAPGHEQYTRNMVTAASSADAAVVLVDATKLDWQNPALATAAANPPPQPAGQAAARARHGVCREQAGRGGRPRAGVCAHQRRAAHKFAEAAGIP
jgi:hypothetical protein